jgi:hypothetical protein
MPIKICIDTSRLDGIAMMCDMFDSPPVVESQDTRWLEKEKILQVMNVLG